MKYLLIEFDNEQYWLEIGNEGYALRQIIIDIDGHIHISCLEDCLAEGIFDENELAGEIRYILQCEFEKEWNIVTLEERKQWAILKKQYIIGKGVECKVKYSYPQGWILDAGQSLGICKSDLELYPNELLNGIINGYDEVNMWVLISVE